MDRTILLSHRLGLSGVTLQGSTPLPEPYPRFEGFTVWGHSRSPAGGHMGGWAPSSWRAPGRWCHLPALQMTMLWRPQPGAPDWAQMSFYPDSATPDPKSPMVATLLHQKGGGTSQDPSADLSSRTRCSGVQRWGLNSRQTDQSVHRPCPAGLRAGVHALGWGPP